jgi:hypothetical protein
MKKTNEMTYLFFGKGNRERKRKKEKVNRSTTTDPTTTRVMLIEKTR